MDDGDKLSWGRDLPGNLLEIWPKDNDGEFVAPAFLTTCSQLDMGDTLLINMLEACGIPCLRRFPHYGGFGNLMLGVSAEGVDILVPETMLDDARALMEGEPEDEDL
jgi:hypothetical protein